MARPLRIEYPGAFYHVTSRGNAQKDVFKSQRDREKFLSYESNDSLDCIRRSKFVREVSERRLPHFPFALLGNYRELIEGD